MLCCTRQSTAISAAWVFSAAEAKTPVMSWPPQNASTVMASSAMRFCFASSAFFCSSILSMNFVRASI